jgi:hypothetical protein
VSSRSDPRRLLSANLEEVRLVTEAALLLALIRLGVSLLSFRRLTSLLRLSEIAADGPVPASPPEGEPAATVIGAVAGAVRAAADRTPWDSTCLVRSLTAHEMLRRRHITSTVHLGVAKQPAGDIAAHSWLDSGGSVVTGAHGHESFTPIALLVSSRPA